MLGGLTMGRTSSPDGATTGLLGRLRCRGPLISIGAINPPTGVGAGRELWFLNGVPILSWPGRRFQDPNRPLLVITLGNW